MSRENKLFQDLTDLVNTYLCNVAIFKGKSTEKHKEETRWTFKGREHKLLVGT